ncbi:family 20 glycosylhydrolase [Streptomyces sp. AcE210]|uniref:family 20 glycosylhydrolase n=1 Tax=Streptomyces sp. AcE210 TaxID=2292703 RepID=UPI0014050270|nr:family 20 glycosylhydrolase [Streptomyces sp. AcE210]
MSYGARRLFFSVLAAGAIAAATLAPGNVQAAGSEVGGLPGPAVVPALQNWSGGADRFTLTRRSRIVVDAPAASRLAADARTFADDIEALGGDRLPVVTGHEARKGDIAISARSGAGEGFRIDIDADSVSLAGDGPAGAFYAQQSVEQMLKTAADRASLPVGSTHDSPAQKTRGLMIDTARTYWSVDSIKQTIRQLAWTKLNTLHWHLTDSEFFRLDLPGYHGLAAVRSYTPADLREVQDYAARYHVTVLPEFDIPAHATALTHYRPSLRWGCPSMNAIIDTNRVDPGFTVDITEPENVAWLDGLVGRITDLFDSPVIHLGGDETPRAAAQAQCPELADYAAAHGYSKTEDVFLAYENHLNDLLAARGKRMQIWGWWPQTGGGGSVTVDKDIRIQAWLGDEDTFIQQGYDVVVSNEFSRLYVVPKAMPGTANGTYIPDDDALYRTYAVSASPHVQGLEMAQWGDRQYTAPEAYSLSYLRRPLQILASTAWGSPRLTSYLDYEVMADAVGTAPGVPENADPDARPVQATAYGPDGAGNAADGDPTTAFAATTPGAAVGLDLGADGAVRPAAVRLLPRSTTTADLSSLVGATVQGCTDGPDSGCTPLTRIEWTPTRDWQTLPLDTERSYRWLRLVGAVQAKPVVAELQVLAASGPVQLTVRAPKSLNDSGRTTVETTVTNTTSRPLERAAVRLSALNTRDNTDLWTSQPVEYVTVPPHQTRTVRVVARLASHPNPGPYRVRATIDHRHGDDRGSARGSALVTVPPRTLSEAYDNIGITEDGNPQPGDIDGGQSSFSATGLAAAGAEAGSELASDGFAFKLPPADAHDSDNAVADGQTIPLTGHATRVGLLVTGTYVPAAGASGEVTLTYTDGTRSTARITVPDWGATTLPPGAVVAANGGKVNGSSRAQAGRTANLYTVHVAADPSKRLASLTLPTASGPLSAKTPLIHVFALAADGQDNP